MHRALGARPGLGLWIVKEIITARGRIWVESEMGVETTVYFTSPAAPRGAA